MSINRRLVLPLYQWQCVCYNVCVGRTGTQHVSARMVGLVPDDPFLCPPWFSRTGDLDHPRTKDRTSMHDNFPLCIWIVPWWIHRFYQRPHMRWMEYGQHHGRSTSVLQFNRHQTSACCVHPHSRHCLVYHQFHGIQPHPLLRAILLVGDVSLLRHSRGIRSLFHAKPANGIR